jgi:hypothetical protein
MRQTAVEWLAKQMLWNEFHNPYLEKAKEIEKEQIIDAHGKQLKKTQTAGNYEYWLTGEQYYKETYEKK